MSDSHRSSVFSRHPRKLVRRSMDRIRRSFRDSFRRRGSKERGLSTSGNSTDSSKPQQWQQDEASVRAGTCNFFVKYLGCVEVYESRGMQVCEEALKVLRAQRRRPVKGVLYVSGDGLRVVDAENKGLIVDQTIEKVSFCAPDRSHEKGFAYICRDGTTRRWMCHGFHAVKETGERLSHAVGCAFAVCLEKKQKRDRESQMAGSAPTASNSTHSVSGILVSSAPPNLNNNLSNAKDQTVQSADNFVRQGSFRHASLTERMQDPQNVIPAEPPPPAKEPVLATAAVPRPAPNPQLFERQGSLRMPVQNGPAFRRQHSLRIGDLPSTLNRQQEVGGGFLPGARVSAIPEEGPTTPQEGGMTGACQELTDNLKNFHLANSMSNPEVTFTSRSQAGGSPTPLSARSRAEEWLESTLLSTTGQNTPRRGTTPPAGTNLNGYGGGPTPTPPPEPCLPPKDIFGQPQFIPPPRPPRFGQVRSQSLDTTTVVPSSGAYPNLQRNFEKIPTLVEDPFEAKWQALEKRQSTNPFNSQSTGVNI